MKAREFNYLSASGGISLRVFSNSSRAKCIFHRVRPRHVCFPRPIKSQKENKPPSVWYDASITAIKNIPFPTRPINYWNDLIYWRGELTAFPGSQHIYFPLRASDTTKIIMPPLWIKSGRACIVFCMGSGMPHLPHSLLMRSTPSLANRLFPLRSKRFWNADAECFDARIFPKRSTDPS